MSRATWIPLLVAAAVCLGACQPAIPLADRLERDLLSRQKAALERELGMEPGRLESDVVVVIPAGLVDELLEVALPAEALIAERFVVTVERGQVDFTAGLALVRLEARVGWADRDDVSANVDIHGILQVLEVPESGTLTSRVEILGFETQAVRLGTLSPPAGRLLDELARRPAGELNDLLARIDIPVRLVPAITLPRVEENELTIEAAEIPLRGQLRDVRVGNGQLRIHIDVAISAEAL